MKKLDEILAGKKSVGLAGIYPLERKTDGSDPPGRKNKKGSAQSELLGI